jgi:hypothetical protein
MTTTSSHHERHYDAYDPQDPQGGPDLIDVKSSDPDKKGKPGLSGRAKKWIAGLTLAGVVGGGAAVAFSGNNHEGGPDVPSTSAPADPTDTSAEPWVRATPENVVLVDDGVEITGVEAYLNQHEITTAEYPETEIKDPRKLLDSAPEPTNELAAFNKLLSNNLNDALNLGCDPATANRYEKYLSTDGSEHGFEAFNEAIINPVLEDLVLSKDADKSFNLSTFLRGEHTLNVKAATAGVQRTSHVEVISVNNAGDKEEAGLSVTALVNYTSGTEGSETTAQFRVDGWLVVDHSDNGAPGSYKLLQGELTPVVQ